MVPPSLGDPQAFAQTPRSASWPALFIIPRREGRRALPADNPQDYPAAAADADS